MNSDFHLALLLIEKITSPTVKQVVSNGLQWGEGDSADV
jgi:hypothetical protein